MNLADLSIQHVIWLLNALCTHMYIFISWWGVRDVTYLSIHLFPLRKVLLSLPEPESAQETGLAQLNSLLLQLCDPTEPTHHLTAAAVGWGINTHESCSIFVVASWQLYTHTQAPQLHTQCGEHTGYGGVWCPLQAAAVEETAGHDG